MANLQFNAQTVEPRQSFAPIPAGVYPAQIVESDLKPLKSGNGQGLSLQFEILGNQHAGRRIFANLNINHSNPQAQQIAQQDLSSICHAVGVLQLQDSQQLHGKPMNIRVKIRKQEGYEDRNEISGYEPLAGAVPPAAAKAQLAGATQQSSAPRKPWERAA